MTTRQAIIRVRQRDRSGQLAGFDRNLVPHENEWGIDGITINLGGNWQSAPTATATDLFHSCLSLPGANWFCLPERRGSQLELSTRTPVPCTLGSLTLIAKGISHPTGSLTVEIKANPTRTLAALLSRFGEQEGFASLLEALPPVDFFTNAPPNVIPASLDGSDNWIPNPSVARGLLGRNLFGVFLPIYVGQLQALLGTLIAEHEDGWRFSGCTQVAPSALGQINLNWADVRVPQLECYFERFHARAIDAVRYAGMAFLTQDHRSQVRRYSGDVDLQREADCFRIAMPAGATRKLIVYAKRADRIRFEVRRDGRGRYASSRSTQPGDRLLEIIRQERRHAEASCRWSEIGQQFDEADTPTAGDLIALISAILKALGVSSEPASSIMRRLLVDGGLSPSVMPDLPRGLVTRLLAAGIIRRTRLRSRDLRGSGERYSLRPPYNDLRDYILRALLPDADQ